MRFPQTCLSLWGRILKIMSKMTFVKMESTQHTLFKKETKWKITNLLINEKNIYIFNKWIFCCSFCVLRQISKLNFYTSTLTPYHKSCLAYVVWVMTTQMFTNRFTNKLTFLWFLIWIISRTSTWVVSDLYNGVQMIKGLRQNLDFCRK